MYYIVRNNTNTNNNIQYFDFWLKIIKHLSKKIRKYVNQSL